MGCAGSKAPPEPGGELPADSQEEVWLRKRQQAAERRRSRHVVGGGGPAGGLGGAAAPAGLPPTGALRRQPTSSLGSSDSDSDVASDWDRYSWHLEAEHPGKASRPGSPAAAPEHDGLTGQPAEVCLLGCAVMRHDSLFGLSTAPALTPVRDSGQLRLCKVSGCTFVNQYMVIKGSSGRVFLCMGLDDYRLYAVKIVKKDQAGQRKAARSGAARRPRDPLEDLRREIAVMRRSLHPNVVALREVVDDSSSNKMLLVMDYMEGGPVMTREGLERGHRIPEEVARLYFRDMCKALDYLHCARKVVHGDLKPENALMGAAGRVALSDFGCSKVLSESDAQFERCNGTPAFLAPEMMRPNARYRGRPADVYALGGCLYSFVFGKIPFRHAANTAIAAAAAAAAALLGPHPLFEVVQTQPVTFPADLAASEELRGLLLGMLEKDPEKRLSLAQVMAHPWLMAGGALPPLRSCLQRDPGQRPQRPPADGATAAAAGVDAEGDGSGAEQQQQHPGKEEGEEEEEREREQQEQLLKGSLEGLVADGGLQVHSFAAGEHLMTRGQAGARHMLPVRFAGAHLLYILEGECEVLYKTAPLPPPQAPAPAAPAASKPASASQQQQQQQQQHIRQVQEDSSVGSRAGDTVGGPAAAAGKRRSAAALFTPSVHARDRHRSAEPAAGPEGSLASTGTQAAQQQQQQQRHVDALCSLRDSSYIAEAAVAAAEDMDGAGAAQGVPQQAPSSLQRLESTASSYAQIALPNHRTSSQAEGGAALPPAGGSALPPLPPKRQPIQQPQPQQQLHVSIPAAQGDPSTPNLSPESSGAGAAGGSGGATPPQGSPEGLAAAAAAAAAATPSPGPYGLQRHMGVDLEGAAAHLYSPGPPSATATSAPAGPGASPAARAAGQEELQLSEGGQQVQQGQQGQRQGSPQPEVEGEELPPTLLDAATRAKEVLESLRRGPRLFLAARRGPGDFVGEMEALGGSQSRRVATVVAASSIVQAVLIPYPAAKSYLAQCPLAKQQLAQLMWLRQSEDIVLEALARLAALGDDMLRLLRQ
ncbi:hypothetical protein CHLNCDRAFT_143521 [Chlorella variabilis]|uniref:Protein kinase domain-containing protein n=1 Tax=Chlorella variabilis TaxID=554065 RepID=E1ZB35_CHLVA|nr:hypothetical protein CHLNCDRAFT_143521 [Chlorella variabilis]EFN56955.1 hypothetical protein CHLNCDRAFT_143521 [Chlorella variabilis]|eukprot:XP_005849057.1 hypothetical protein CHLNCDRAFT_143521 [Chlorella variabilis]